MLSLNISIKYYVDRWLSILYANIANVSSVDSPIILAIWDRIYEEKNSGLE